MISFLKSLSVNEPFEFDSCPDIEFLVSLSVYILTYNYRLQKTQDGIYFKKNQITVQDEIKFLKWKIELLQCNASQVEMSETIKEHMNHLHEYNELKDIGQIIIGKIAEIKGMTTKEIYSEYGLHLTD